MKVNCCFLPHDIYPQSLSDKTCVIIDVLRATSTICTALHNGARQILFASSIDAAKNFYDTNNISGSFLLAGERNAQKIDGFHLGNSPLEFTPDNVKDKNIILTTTNGTRAISKSKNSKKIYTISFLNLSAVAKELYFQGGDIEIVCSGTDNEYSLEDSLCAGMLVKELLNLGQKADLSDAAKIALAIAIQYGGNIERSILDSYHGKVLISRGFEPDVKYCARQSIMQVVHQVEVNDIID